MKVISLGMTNIDITRFNPIENGDIYIHKPKGGLWTCPYTPDKEYPSAWIDWCVCESYQTARYTSGVIYNIDDSRVYTIDNWQDLFQLIDLFPFEFIDTYDGRTLYKINFEEVSKVYDAIYLTEKGQIETRFAPELPNGSSKDLTHGDLYGWDCESILILNPDCIDFYGQKYIENIFDI